VGARASPERHPNLMCLLYRKRRMRRGDRPTLSVLAPLEPTIAVGGEGERSCVGRSAERVHVGEERVACMSGRRESGVGVG